MFQLNNETRQLLFLYLQGELTPQNKEQLLEWRNRSEENGRFMDELDDPSTFYEKWERFNSIDVNEGMTILKQRHQLRQEKAAVKTRTVRFVGWFTVKVAVVFIIAWAVYTLWLSKPSATTLAASTIAAGKTENELVFDDANYTMRTAKGHTDTVKFSEGSIARIGPASTLRFPTSFASHSRQVSLLGKGNFEVKHILDEQQLPVQDFRVQVQPSAIMKQAMSDSALTIIAEGTNFTVIAYPDDSMIRTTLYTGKLHIIGRNIDALIKAGQVYELYADGHSDIRQTDDNSQTQPSEREKEWFQFHEESVNNVLKELSRWKKTVLLNPDNISGLVSFECPHSLTLDDILKHMTLQLNAHYKHISPDTICIKAGR